MTGWKDLPWWNSNDWKDLKGHLDGLHQGNDFVPNKRDIYRALALTPLHKVKAVILGQDPYPTMGMADGLAFSTKTKKIPLSLRNIFSEYRTDLSYPYPSSGDLSPWARQGVLLWNTYLTVKPGHPLSHKNFGWDILTKQVLKAVFDTNPNTVFILWGKEAQKLLYGLHFNAPAVVQSSHPSPMAARDTFFGSKPFSRCNALLQREGVPAIDWRLP